MQSCGFGTLVSLLCDVLTRPIQRVVDAFTR